MTDAQTEARAIAQRLERAVKRAEEHAGMMPARQAVKLHPNDWHAVCDLAREAATALAAKDAELEQYLTDRDAELSASFDAGHYRAMSEHATPWRIRAERAEAQLAEARGEVSLLRRANVELQGVINERANERDEARASLAEARKALPQITIGHIRAARREFEAQGEGRCLRR